VHLTNAANGAAINQSGTLVGNIYAGPLSNAGASGVAVTARTGLASGSYQAAVPIPQAGNQAFSQIVPIGPITTWQRLTGQQYTPNGVLNLATGQFTRHGINSNQAGIYIIDAGLTGGTIVIGGGLIRRNQ
jgi:hypothetical protein